jgi:hypothetical protein
MPLLNEPFSTWSRFGAGRSAAFLRTCRNAEGEFMPAPKHITLEAVDFDDRAEVDAFLD